MNESLRVLLVEDSEDDARLILRELKVSGLRATFLRVDTAPEMEAALERETWDVVLSDHNMPSFNALAALQLVQERKLDLPFIIVSGSIGEELVAHAMRAGAHDYILKRDLSRLVASILRALGSVKERAERKRAKIALRESEERYALAVSGSRDALWDWNITTGHVYYSDRLKEILDLETLGSTPETLNELTHKDDRPLVQRALTAHLAHRVPYEVEFRVHTKHGELRWLCSRGQTLRDEAGKATRMAGSLSDITRRKETEELLLQRLRIIESQEKAIRTLSTPIIEVWRGVVMMPVFGVINGNSASHMMEVLLAAVARTRYHYAIIDLTGAEAVDGPTGDHILKLVTAVALIGVRGMVVGIRPEMAQIFVKIGVDLSKITTLATLRDALVLCMKDQRVLGC